MNQYWGPEYESQSAACKEEMIWERCLEDDRTQEWFDGIAQLPIFTQDIQVTFDWEENNKEFHNFFQWVIWT